MKSQIIRKFFSSLLTVCLLVSLFAFSPVALAADYSGTISGNQTWNDGDTVAATTITGPAIVTVSGTVNVTGTITINGDVSFTGGGTLLRSAADIGALINVASGSLTLGNVTLDGGNNVTLANGSKNYVLVNAIVGGTSVTLNDGAILQNNVVMGSNAAGIYLTGTETSPVTLTMNGGIIRNNRKENGTSGNSITGAGIYGAYANITIHGGEITNNTISSEPAVSIYFRGDRANDSCLISPNSALTLDAARLKGDNTGAVYSFSAANLPSGATVTIGGTEVTDFTSYATPSSSFAAISVTLGSGPPNPPPTEDTPYTVSLVPSTDSTTVDADDFTVDLQVSSTETSAEFATLEANFTYDHTKFEYVPEEPAGLVLVAIPDTPNGTGNISLIGNTIPLTTTPTTVATLKFKPIGAVEDAAFAIDSSGLKLWKSGDINDENLLEDVEPGAVTTVTVTVTESNNPVGELSVNQSFTGGFTLIKFKTSYRADGYTYNGVAMYYAPRLGAAEEHYYLTLVPGSVPTAAGTVEFGETAAVALTYDGNLNDESSIAYSPIVNIVDAQIAYDLMYSHTHANYSVAASLDVLSIKDRLDADVDGDGEITLADAQAIQWKARYGVFKTTP